MVDENTNLKSSSTCVVDQSTNLKCPFIRMVDENTNLKSPSTRVFDQNTNLQSPVFYITAAKYKPAAGAGEVQCSGFKV